MQGVLSPPRTYVVDIPPSLPLSFPRIYMFSAVWPTVSHFQRVPKRNLLASESVLEKLAARSKGGDKKASWKELV